MILLPEPDVDIINLAAGDQTRRRALAHNCICMRQGERRRRNTAVRACAPNSSVQGLFFLARKKKKKNPLSPLGASVGERGTGLMDRIRLPRYAPERGGSHDPSNPASIYLSKLPSARSVNSPALVLRLRYIHIQHSSFTGRPCLAPPCPARLVGKKKGRLPLLQHFTRSVSLSLGKKKGRLPRAAGQELLRPHGAGAGLPVLALLAFVSAAAAAAGNGGGGRKMMASHGEVRYACVRYPSFHPSPRDLLFDCQLVAPATHALHDVTRVL